MKILTFDQSRCDLCGACQIVCSLAKKGDFRPEQARIRIQTAGDAVPLRAVVCQHCQEPACVTACMRGIIHKDKETGLVTRDWEHCFQCASCQVLCPVGAAVQDEDMHAFVTCDLCGAAGEPICAAVCPRGALRYEETSANSALRREQYAAMAIGRPGLLQFPGNSAAVMAGAVAGSPDDAPAREPEPVDWKEIAAVVRERLDLRVTPRQLEAWSGELKAAAGGAKKPAAAGNKKTGKKPAGRGEKA